VRSIFSVCVILYLSLVSIILLLLLLLLLTANELSLGGSCTYTGIDKINKNKYTQYKQYETQ
jgi:hypothetical protein